MSNNQELKWAVVGGGMMGLTLAYRLLQRQQQVVLIEAAPVLGGLVSAWRLGDVVWDRFYHVTSLSDTTLRAVLREIGLESQIRWVETKTGFFAGGKLHSMSSSWEFLRFPPLNLWEKMRLAGNIVYASRLSDWQRLEKIPVEDWLRRWSGRSTAEKIWFPLIRGKLGDLSHRTSAAFIWAYIQRMYKARRTGHKKEMFGYVPGGYARTLERMNEVIAALGGEIRLGTPVNQITSLENGLLRVEPLDGESELFDRVIMTTPSPFVARVCPELSAIEREKHNSIEYIGIVCASLLLRKPISDYYVTNIIDDGLPITGVVEMSTIVDPSELGGHHLVYLPRYVSSKDPLLDQSDEQLQEMFLSTLKRMYPDYDLNNIVTVKIARARQVMALPTLSYSQNLPPMRTSVPGLFTINSSYIVKGNLNVNETMEIAENAIHDVIDPEIAQASSRPVEADAVTPA